MPAKRTIPNLNHLIERYRTTSLSQLSLESGISRSALHRALLAAGVPVRGPSDAERLKWAWMSGPARTRQVAQANAARRGAIDTPERKEARARTRQARVSHSSDLEARVAEVVARSTPVIRQLAIGPYNVDMAIMEGCSVAVEIQRGDLNRERPGSSLKRERVKHLLDRGWALLVVFFRDAADLDPEAVGQQVIRFADIARRQPAPGGVYGMVGGDGQPVTPRGFQGYDAPRVPGF